MNRIVHDASHSDASSDHGRPRSCRTEKVSWAALPKKKQLAILTLARLSEPLTQTSLQSYMFYQLKSFKLSDGSAPSDSVVARQAGMLAAAFTGTQFLTAILWGRIADSGMGRKRVILIGLLGTAIGTVGFGFSDSFWMAITWRLVGGALNGNVGVMRTMISEIVEEKKFQSRAFLLLPMTFNIGVIIGPLLGGLLADPAGNYPDVFGPGGTFGGEYGVWLFMRWPYALPNLISAAFLVFGALAVFLGLEETLQRLSNKPDLGIMISRSIGRLFSRNRRRAGSVPLRHTSPEQDVELHSAHRARTKTEPRVLPFHLMWTPNVMFTFLAHGLLAMHVGTFSSLWFVFLSTPRYLPAAIPGGNDGQKTSALPPGYQPHLPFTFTGGLGLPPSSMGTALSILGVIGISLQLLVYPRLNFRFGTVKSYRAALILFPVAYVLTPYLAMVPSDTPPQSQASGLLIWIAITFVLSIQTLARTFALPATAILVNNCSPHPSVLGSIHGVGQSVSAGTRTVGPVVAGWLYGIGLDKGVVGTAWWVLAAFALFGAIAGRWVRDGDGHEIWLPGEKEDLQPGEGPDTATR
ncbi:MFS general substrate transporter [Dissoconium aciculare CBS 342.82]|uniref:MFS general substrate transporter n=1 Tax=Dissoconium aciculare CBS 342.82 TaxID=1314786 RepID=A0A6J3M894_9PEZI|nr:MFS general substrate transporter [Dissoconium aciculare CBS 342.82]KAF1823819.1 MFS general substrate transporter [Dissoconium aciculare CBS 342.82]